MGALPTIPSRTATAILAASLVAGLAAGLTWSAFSSQTQNSGNGFTARATFGPSFVKTLGTSACGGATSAISVPAGGAAAGNTVVVAIGLRGAATGTVSATDTRGNTYTADADVTNSNVRTVVLSSRLTAALNAGDAIAVSHPFSDDSQGAAAAEFAGVVTGSRVDATNTTVGQSGSPTATVATTNASDLLIGTVANQNSRTYTEHSGWSTLSHVMPSCGGAPGSSTLHTAYRIVSSTGSFTYAPTIAQSERWAEALVAYKG